MSASKTTAGLTVSILASASLPEGGDNTWASIDVPEGDVAAGAVRRPDLELDELLEVRTAQNEP